MAGAGRANSWTPALNQSWTWGKDRINGVNLGGLFVLEPFIVPAVYEQWPKSVDEWTLSVNLQAKGKLQEVLEDHYNTFITEEDLAQIAGAGLNWVRLPVPFWAVETWDDVGVDANGQKVSEPFLANFTMSAPGTRARKSSAASTSTRVGREKFRPRSRTARTASVTGSYPWPSVTERRPIPYST